MFKSLDAMLPEILLLEKKIETSQLEL